ncbi:MAG TPA: murein biosynthesis integral membrane protein MurJ [Longilinea sp.]|nr:murein biosynthesis integral membrane protein MurJ [Longilinea sp.]
MSRLTRASLQIAIFFALDKLLAILRQVIIARQFGLSAALDAFNVANNIPDMLYVLITGGGLALAFIPVLSEVLTKEGRDKAWALFSQIANLAFLVTAVLALLITLFAEPLVRSTWGVAPGFSPDQQDLVVSLMRLDLIATLIFSFSGLAIAGLQANQHFLLPAMAPLMYNLGQIFGATILAPTTGYQIGPLTLPALGLGVHGLVYGAVIGATLHFSIQIPGLIIYGFRWRPKIDLHDAKVVQVLKLLGPRVLTMLFIQLTFIARDNIASHLAQGAVTALTYGYMIVQVPETLIGTAIGTALLPTLSEHVAREELESFKATINRAVQVMVAIALPSAIILILGIRPLLQVVFAFKGVGTDLLYWTAGGFLLGLIGQCLVEVGARSFYAQQDAITPLLAAGMNLCLYIVLASIGARTVGAPGISLGDSLAFTSEAIALLLFLNLRFMHRQQGGQPFFRRIGQVFSSQPELNKALLRAVSAAILGGSVVVLVRLLLANHLPSLVIGVAGMVLGVVVAMPLIWKELRMLVHL